MKRALMKAAAVLVLLAAGWRRSRLRTSTSPAAVPISAPLVRAIVKHPWLTATFLGAVGAVAALLVVISGLVPIKASSGHWAITAALLDFAKVRSVSTHALGIEPPLLDDPALVLRGAGHYESGCYPCHGGPDADVPPVMAAMTPVPPNLPGGISRWEPQELFSIVKHGIKFTGMPAWPVQQRDDEVWAVVAFLRTMPTLDATSYQTLVYGNTRDARDAVSNPPATGEDQAPSVVRDVCWRCHGRDGTGRGPGAFPSLAGQRSAYLYASLRAFADRNRFSGIMRTVAANLGDQTMREVAEYYESLPARRVNESGDPGTIARGEAIAARGIPDREVPSCADCHGADDTPRNPAYPRLAGQHERYLALQLELLKAGRRGGSDYVNLMHVFVGRLGPEHIRDVTSYFASLRAQPNTSSGALAAQ